MKFSPSKQSTGYTVVLECLTYMPAEPERHCFVQKSPVMVPWDKGIRKRIRIIFPGRRFKVCYSYSRSIPKRLPRSVYLKTAANQEVLRHCYKTPSAWLVRETIQTCSIENKTVIKCYLQLLLYYHYTILSPAQLHT